MKLFMVVLTLIALTTNSFSAVKAKKKMENKNTESVVLAGGCFWGVQDLIRKISGVISSRVGYSGGYLKNPTYNDVKTGTTGHAEAVEVVFDPAKVSLDTILDYFFRLHDPTTLNRQGNDIGTQYRSAIFYKNEAQKKVIEAKKAAVEKSGKWKRPITTQIVPFDAFYQAEDYHQDYLVKHPDGYTCHYLRD